MFQFFFPVILANNTLISKVCLTLLFLKWRYDPRTGHGFESCWVTWIFQVHETIDLFSLYILFSHFRPRDATRGNSFFQMSSYARANLHITNEKTKGKFPWGHHMVWNEKTRCTSWKGLLLKLSSKCEDHIFIWFQTPHFISHFFHTTFSVSFQFLQAIVKEQETKLFPAISRSQW